MRIDHNDIYLLTILGEAPETTTNELAQKMNVSAKTVQRQLTKLQEIIEQLEMGIQLTINPSKGIQLEGDYNQLPLLIQRMKQLAVNEEQDRLLYIVSVLLNSTEAVTLQTFADDMYIARSTVEKAVHDARNFLSDFDVEIEGTRKGLVINANESLKRKILSELIREYWHGIVVNIDGSQEGLIDISLNSQLMPAIEVSILNEVQHLVYQFMKDNGLSFNEDQYQSLVIYISVMIDRIRKHHYIDEVEVKTKVPMIDLTSQLIQQLKNTFTMEIPVFERQYIATYLLVYFVGYRFFGKDYDAVVMSAGELGHGLGSTATAMVNMNAVTEKYGPSPKAFLIVPIVGSFLVDIIYQPQTIWFISQFVEL